MARDLTLTEATEAFRALEAEIGSQARVFCGLNRHGIKSGLIDAAIYPDDIIGKTCLRVAADNWRDLLAASREVWAEHAELHAANVVREMAIAIIALTADLGECTDAALRAKFDGADIARYGERAVEQANAIASNGPFSIIPLSGANSNSEAA
jgi:hypothetical protein